MAQLVEETEEAEHARATQLAEQETNQDGKQK